MITKCKKQIIRYGIITVIAFCLASLVSFISFDKNIAQAGTQRTVPAGAETVYVGDIIKAEDYGFTSGNKSVPAEGMVVVYPNGGVYGGESFEITQAGNYQITYYATIQGEKVEQVENYLAIRKPKNIMILENGMNAEVGEYYVESPYKLEKGITGTIVNFKSGQSVTFSTTVETAKLTSAYNILEFIVMPSVFKETDFERITVLIADAKDPNNYVEVIIDSSNTEDGDGQVSYVRAGAFGQQSGGYEGSKYHTSSYGAQVEHSFRGLGCVAGFREKITVSEQILTLSIDHATKQVFVGPASSTTTEKNMVNDLDDPAHFKSNPWKGFTSDEVTVKVTAGKFVKGEGKVVFTSFGDYDLSSDIIDDVSPIINLDYDFNYGTPVAVVGQDFPLFAHETKDALDSGLTTNVWVYHLSTGGQWVTTNHDGEKFEVKHSGTYKIVYQVIDNSGNKTERVITINAVDAAPAISAETGETYIEKEVYQEVHIPLPSQINVVGGSGRLVVEREVVSPSGEVLDVLERLLLTEVGEYMVVYTVTDYLGNEEGFPVFINAVEIAQPKFVTEPSFEDALIKGFNYQLPKVHVIETVDGEVLDVECKTYVNDVLVEGGFVADGSAVTIRYEALGSSSTTVWEKTIPVVDTQNGKLRDKYFYVEGGLSLTVEKNYLNIDVTEDGIAKFINAISSSSFSTTFYFDAAALKFETMKFILRDAKAPSLTVTFSFKYDAIHEGWYMYLNDGEKVEFITSKEVFNFTYLRDKNKVKDASGEEIASITMYDNGEAFSGFSDTIYFAVAFEGVNSDSSIQLSQLGGQSMGHNKKNPANAQDETAPIIELDEMFIHRQELGTVAKIPTARAYDVLGQVESLVVVIEQSGLVLATGTMEEPINFMLDKAGQYTVKYIATDTNGIEDSIPYTIFVRDKTAPVLNVTNNLKKEYSLGSKVYIPKYTVSDNDGDYTVQVTVILPNNEMRLLEYNENGTKTSYLDIANNVYDDDFKTGDGGFIIQSKGLYVLRIVAYDEYYNYVAVEIKFNVK